MPTPPDHEIFSRLIAEIVQGTAAWQENTQTEEALPSSADLARRLNYRLDTVKKKLRILKENGLIQPVSMTPKRYRFNPWGLKELAEDSLLYTLFCDPESSTYIESGNHHH